MLRNSFQSFFICLVYRRWRFRNYAELIGDFEEKPRENFCAVLCFSISSQNFEKYFPDIFNCTLSQQRGFLKIIQPKWCELIFRNFSINFSNQKRDFNDSHVLLEFLKSISAEMLNRVHVLHYILWTFVWIFYSIFNKASNKCDLLSSHEIHADQNFIALRGPFMLPSEVGAGMWSLAHPDLSILISHEVKFGWEFLRKWTLALETKYSTHEKFQSIYHTHVNIIWYHKIIKNKKLIVKLMEIIYSFPYNAVNDVQKILNYIFFFVRPSSFFNANWDRMSAPNDVFCQHKLLVLFWNQ